jgi:hypothetical protein
MGLRAVVFQALLSFNRLLYQWAHGVSKLNGQRVVRHNKNYDLILQEFVLIKTQYKILTNVLKKKNPKIHQDEFRVRVLE